MQILRLPQVKTMTGLSRSTIYLRISEGSFPKQIKLGERAVGWESGSIERWIEGCINDTQLELPDEKKN